MFDKIQSLVIHREVFNLIGDDCELIIRHFSPSLRLLIILIDDEVDIENSSISRITTLPSMKKNGVEVLYTCLSQARAQGPSSTCFANYSYSDCIEADLKEYFAGEKADYELNCYLPPYVQVMVARMPTSPKNMAAWALMVGVGVYICVG